MHGEIAIAEPEPSLATKATDSLHEIPALAGAAPAAFHVGKTAECIDDRVDVRRDMQPELLEIITGVDDDGEVGADRPFQPQRKLGAADAAAQSDHGPAVKG